MDQFLYFLETHWFAVVLLALAVVLTGVALWRRQRQVPALGWLLAGCMCALLGAGGLALPEAEWAVWLAAGAVAALLLLLAVVILSGNWSALLGYFCGAVLLLGLGGLIVPLLGYELLEFGKFLFSLTPLQPWWLLLLLAIPLIIWISFRSLAGLSPTRRVLVIGLRCAAIALLVLALAEAQASRQNEDLTVLFVWDQSLSIPVELDEENNDLRQERILKFINDSVWEHGRSPHEDKIGLIAFGRWPRLGLPPERVEKLKLNRTQLNRLTGNIDRSYTDISAALKLALASFPEGTNKRIVLISDGNENLGNAEEQAQIAKRNGVQIDVVPLATTRENNQEVVVLGIIAPSATEKDARLLLHVLIHSYSPDPVKGTLTLTRSSLVPRGKKGQEKFEFETAQLGEPEEVTLYQGKNPFTFQAPPAPQGESYTYHVKFTPKEGTLPGDRVENNQASTQVVARGQRAVLLIEPETGDHQLLVDRLKQSKSSLKIISMEPEALPQDPGELALLLSKFDSVILANVPAEKFTDQQQKVFRSNTHDQGCGLIMVGGPNSFGSGGWQNTEVEKALPVTCDLKSVKVEGKGGLVLIMHASELMQGVFLQKQVAAKAAEKLSPVDMVGVLVYDHGAGDKWHVPFQQIGPNKDKILKLIDSMDPGDMPDLTPTLQMAYDELTDPRHNLATRHIIFISDGDHWNPPLPLLFKVREKKITLTTVCITAHGEAFGQSLYKKMAQVASLTGGNHYPKVGPDGTYKALEARELPQIYIKEARLVSKSFLYLQKFLPSLVQESGPAVGLPKNLEPLHGFVLTTKRESPLVEVPIWSPPISKERFPILAHWHYGLGKAAAFTSDARTVPGTEAKIQPWDIDWARSEMHGKFWDQMVDWSLRAVESGENLTISTAQKDGKIRLVVKAQDENKVPLTDVEFEAGITSPSLKTDPNKGKLKFEQTKPGVYEAEIKAEEVGSYFLNVQGKWKDEKGQLKSDNVRTGVTIPYSPEFAEMSSNLGLLKRLTDITGGQMYAEVSEVLDEVAKKKEVFRPVLIQNLHLQPIWPWLILLAGVCLFFDVALRRLAFEPEKLIVAAQSFWARLRGHRIEVAAAPQFLDRLQSRKSQIGQEIEKSRAKRRFEAGEVPVSAPPGAADAPAGSAPTSERRPAVPEQKIAPEKEAEPQDFASRLKKAKQRVWKDRDKEK